MYDGIAIPTCGFCAKAQDAVGFAKVIEDFLAYPEKDKLAQNAKKYYNEYFTRELFMQKLEKELINHLS